MEKKIVRQVDSRNVDDPSSIAANTYNKAVGAQKNMEMGHHLRPICIGATWTTDLTTKRGIGKGRTLAIYNNSSTLYSVTIGDSSVSSLAAGTVSGDNAGIPCMPNAWTYVATYDKDWAITSNAALLCFLVEDPTYIVDQNNVNQAG